MIKTIEEPFSREGGLAILKGNLALDGSVVKPAAIPKHLFKFSGKAKIFNSEQEAIDGILNGEVMENTAVILRYEGPKGGPGMPEMYRPMKCLEGMDLSDTCVIVTDGRFSGSNRGCFVGHISPEAFEGGTIGLIEDGDVIQIDIEKRSIHLAVSEDVLEQRRKTWTPLVKKVDQGYLETYQRISKSAAAGAVIDVK